MDVIILIDPDCGGVHHLQVQMFEIGIFGFDEESFHIVDIGFVFEG